MADDIDELLDEVESKFIHPQESEKSENAVPSQTIKKRIADETGEIDAAIHSICSITEPIESTSGTPELSVNLQLQKDAKRRCTVVYVGDSAAASGLSGGVTQRKNIHRRIKHSTATKIYTKKYFAKPVFELSVKDLEAENARRKQKEIIERLFSKRLAVVTDKMILDVRKFKRIKSDVWSNFGDVRLLIGLAEVKAYNIDHHIIRIGDEEVVLCKSFVACVKCSAVFSYESHSYGTSTLRSHLKSCGKHKQKAIKKVATEKSSHSLSMRDDETDKPVFQEKMVKFRDNANKLQEQVLMFFLSKLKPFNMLENQEFKDLLQTFIQIGATAGNVDISNYLCSPNDLLEYLVNDVYAMNEEAFKFEIQFLYGLNFSTEIWLDIVEKRSYITFSCHYSNFEGVLKSVMFHTSEFPYEQKNSTDLYTLFQDCLPLAHTDFKKLFVVDYSYNMVHAFKTEQFIQCICYSTNCAVQTVINALNSADEKENDEDDKDDDNSSDDPFAFPSFVSLLAQCRSLVQHFKDNKLQSSLPKNLKMCSSVCWMPILDMLESINSQWEHIEDILIDRHELELFCFDQELLSMVVDFLEVFRDGYMELSSLANPTLNLVLPWINKWKTHCLQNEDESPFIAAVKSFMSSSIDTEVVKRITINHKLATMLDPRFKELQFLSEDDRLETRNHAEFLVKECSEIMLLNGIDIVHNSAMAEDQLLDVYGSENEATTTQSDQEVEDYLLEDFVMGKRDLDRDSKFNPLKYWNQAKTRFPLLTRVALWTLSCPASAIRTDECFLGSEWMVTIKETDLPRKHIHKCLFNKSFKGFCS